MDSSTLDNCYLPDALSPCFQVRRSCAMLMENESWTSLSSTTSNDKRSVEIDSTKLTEVAQTLITASEVIVNWDDNNWHYTASSPECRAGLTEEQRNERVALYVMVLDALNFCFWPSPGLQYEHLAVALQAVAKEDEELLLSAQTDIVDWNDKHYALSPSRLSCSIACEKLLRKVTLHLPPEIALLPNFSERIRLCNEIGVGLTQKFDGKVMTMIQTARRSADRLVYLITETFPGFRDSTVDENGRQLFFYKRAQILVGDLWASLGGKDNDSYCDFTDIHKLTMFADYRVPQLLRHMQILQYSPALADRVDSTQIIMAGSMDECYIRAATVVAVEKMVQVIKDYLISIPKAPSAPYTSTRCEGSSPDYWCAIRLDWHLWQMGELLDQQGVLQHHHRVNTIYY